MSDKKSNNELVREFYEMFKQDEFVAPSDKPAKFNEDRLLLKMKLIQEEFVELVEAVYGKAAGKVMDDAWAVALELDDKTRDIVEAADATGDLRYVLEGFDIEHGIPSEAVFNEIHQSNLSKLDDDGNPVISDGVTPALDGEVKPIGKVIKSKNYFDPDIKSILLGEEPKHNLKYPQK